MSATDALLAAAKAVLAHLEELEEAWRRGALSEHDGQGGTRSNRNVELRVLLRKTLGAVEAEANQKKEAKP